MTALDGVLAAIALLVLALFLSVLMYYVPRTPLIVVCAGTIALAAFDFIREYRIARRAAVESR